MKLASYALAAFALVNTAFAGLEDVKTGKKLTAANFDSEIAGKHALVAVHASWCGHCKNLAPTWEKLGKDFEDDETVVIGQIDGDAAENKVITARYGVKGFPTIKFFPADGSGPLDYSGPRTEEAFVDFVNEKAGTHRTVGGLLNTLAGRIPSFDTLLSQFLASSVATRDSVYNQARDLAESFKTDANKSVAAAYYLKVIDKVQSNSDWASSELSRLQKLASKRGALAGKQLDDLTMRQNILSAYQNAVSAASSLGVDASASVGSAASQVSSSASSASSVISSAINSATGGAVGAQAQASASSASASAASAASSVTAQGGASASSASNAAYGAASSISKQAGASASSASGAAASAASSISKQAAASASSAGVAGAAYTESAKSLANEAYASGESIASQAYASGESFVSQASASVDSATSSVAAQATGAAQAVKGAAESAYGKIAGEL